MKLKKRIPAKKYYTPQEVNDKIGSNRVPLHNLLYTHVAAALSKLPLRIVDKFLKECFFITYSGTIKGHCFYSSLINKRTIIYISWYHLKRATTKKIENTILHEVAHWYLNHSAGMLPNSPLNSTIAETQERESEADHQVKKWLQDYDKAPLTVKLDQNAWNRELWRVNGIEV